MELLLPGLYYVRRDSTGEGGQIGAIPGRTRPAPPMSPSRPEPTVSDWLGCTSSISDCTDHPRGDTAHSRLVQ